VAGADLTKRSVAKLAPKDICPVRELADFLAKEERAYLETRKMSRRKSSRRHSVGCGDIVAALGTPRLLAVCETLVDTPSISDRAVQRVRVQRDRSISTPYLHKRSDPAPGVAGANEFTSPFLHKRSEPVE
jgi:hypothetical protein